MINGLCTNKRCPAGNNKSRVWEVFGLRMEFISPVTFQTAKETYYRHKKKREGNGKIPPK